MILHIWFWLSREFYLHILDYNRMEYLFFQYFYNQLFEVSIRYRQSYNICMDNIDMNRGNNLESYRNIDCKRYP
jgi:hypothetical protein